MPLHISNVAYIDPKHKKKLTKLAYKLEGDKKVRLAKASKLFFSVQKSKIKKELSKAA